MLKQSNNLSQEKKYLFVAWVTLNEYHNTTTAYSMLLKN